MKKAILAVSFGTSYPETSEKTIAAIERSLKSRFADFEIRRAFTSRMIVKILKKRDQIHVDTVDEALARLASEGFQSVLVQPTHVMNGYENDAMLESIAAHREKFESVAVGNPLLTAIEDYKQLVGELADATPALQSDDTAVVFMGHGTTHHANASYAALDYALKDAGYNSAFVATVEGYPEIEDALRQIKQRGIQKVCLTPLMIVAGDHAQNDMAGDDADSWKNIFEREGFEVDCILRGLGEIEGVRAHFVRHAEDALLQK